MSFGKTLLDIVVRKLEKSFEKTADHGVANPDDGSQAFHDANNSGQDATSSARDEINEEIENHDPAWKEVKDLHDEVMDTIPKVLAGAKYGWIKFVGVVTAIFTGSLILTSIQLPSMSSKQSSALNTTEDSPQTDGLAAAIKEADSATREIDASKAQTEGTTQETNASNAITLPTDDWNIMMGGLEVPSAAWAAAVQEAVGSPSQVPAAAAPIPIAVAAVAAAPIEVDVETPTSRRSFTTTVGQVYRNSPPSVQSAIEQHAIQHDYDNDTSAAFAQHLHEMDENWSRKNFPSSNNQPNNIHVDAVDGDGTKFGSADFHQ